ncbi:MAG: hypothetical protein OXF11_21550 [Deltaproteobacteria bacterium]|nr:hypothetical protein [Deltaproteobacteria bacterium]
MHWMMAHYPAGCANSREYAARARSPEAARRKLALAIRVPLWTVR